MRILTIRREKSIADFMFKVTFYVEDYEKGTTTINKIPCRKLGTLKNGEEKVFEIPEHECKNFATKNDITKNLINEFYQLPAGNMEVFLIGRCRISLFKDDLFIFDNNYSPEAIENRKKSAKKGAAFIIPFILLVGVVAFQVGFYSAYLAITNQSVYNKTFSYEEMSITLPSDFREVENSFQFDAMYTNSEVYVGISKKGIEDLEGIDDFDSYSMEEYLAETLSNDRIIDYRVEDTEAWYSYYYIDDVGIKYYYYANVYKTDDSFWCIQYWVMDSEKHNYLVNFAQWTESITFSEKTESGLQI